MVFPKLLSNTEKLSYFAGKMKLMTKCRKFMFRYRAGDLFEYSVHFDKTCDKSPNSKVNILGMEFYAFVNDSYTSE